VAAESGDGRSSFRRCQLRYGREYLDPLLCRRSSNRIARDATGVLKPGGSRVRRAWVVPGDPSSPLVALADALLERHRWRVSFGPKNGRSDRRSRVAAQQLEKSYMRGPKPWTYMYEG
jgi:hypothetical protein